LLALWCDDEGRRLILGILPRSRAELPPREPADTLAFVPLGPLIAATRGEHTPESRFPGAPFSGRGARGLLQLSQLSGTEQGRLTLFGLAGDLYFTPLGVAAESIAAPARP
jgi:hypothetical protein